MTTIITGANGFLGSKIVNSFVGSDIITLSRTGSDINVDLAQEIPNLPNVDLVIHAAGKAHVLPKTKFEIQSFFDVNLTGTNNLLKGLELAAVLPKSFVFISTVAVYGCESGIMIDENHPLNAEDPYGKSKILAEKLVDDWCKRNHVTCAILRLPLLVGENAPGNLGAMINGISKGYYVNIANGRARKSMVLAEDVAKIIPRAAEVGGIYNLTDGTHPSFYKLSQAIAKQLGKKVPRNIPLWLASIIAKMGDLIGKKAPINSVKLNKIQGTLTFDDAKATKILGWKPNDVLESFKIH